METQSQTKNPKTCLPTTAVACPDWVHVPPYLYVQFAFTCCPRCSCQCQDLWRRISCWTNRPTRNHSERQQSSGYWACRDSQRTHRSGFTDGALQTSCHQLPAFDSFTHSLIQPRGEPPTLNNRTPQFYRQNFAVVKFTHWLGIKRARERTTNQLLPRPVPQFILVISYFKDTDVEAVSLPDSLFVSIGTIVQDHRRR